MVAHGPDVELLTGPMVHWNMSLGQMGHTKWQDHGAYIMAYGTEVNVSHGPQGQMQHVHGTDLGVVVYPMVYCNMSMGQM
jgi:hypothetical protein